MKKAKKEAAKKAFYDMFAKDEQEAEEEKLAAEKVKKLALKSSAKKAKYWARKYPRWTKAPKVPRISNVGNCIHDIYVIIIDNHVDDIEVSIIDKHINDDNTQGTPLPHVRLPSDLSTSSYQG